MSIARNECGLDGNSAAECARAHRMAMDLLEPYRESLSLNYVPTERQTTRLWRNFIEHGLLTLTRPGRPRVSLDEEIEFLSKTTELSTRKMTDQLNEVGLDISRTSVRRRQKKMNMYSYRMPTGQSLTMDTVVAREKFAHSLGRDLQSGKIDLFNTAFTDECIILMDTKSNRQNTRFLRIRGEFDDWEEVMEEHDVHGKSVHCHVTLHLRLGVVGPYFLDEIEPGYTTLTSERYCKLLVEDVIPSLQRGLGEDFDSCHFQQDGAGPHRGHVVRGLLSREFDRRLIGMDLACDNQWPAHSPDLSPLDYWFWSLIKRFVNGQEFTTVEELKQVI